MRKERGKIIKRITSVLLIICLVFALSGCAKLVNTECQKVEVVITDEYHRGMYMTPMRVGKVTSMITHPAIYRITVEYKGVEYTISDSDTYNKYKDRVGQTVIGTLEISTYDNGVIRYNIISLK